MNIKMGFKRLYIVLAVIWALFFTFIGIADQEFVFTFVFGFILPVIVYYIVLWIIKGFES